MLVAFARQPASIGPLHVLRREAWHRLAALAQLDKAIHQVGRLLARHVGANRYSRRRRLLHSRRLLQLFALLEAFVGLIKVAHWRLSSVTYRANHVGPPCKTQSASAALASPTGCAGSPPRGV